MQNFTPADVAVLALELAPALTLALAGERIAQAAARWPRTWRIVFPAVCVLPYVLVACSRQMFSWRWLALYATLPVGVAWMLSESAACDPEQRGNWRDAIVLFALGVPVDLRWFEAAWPAGLAGLGKLLLLDAGLYGFVVLRQLTGTGFDFRPRWQEWKKDWKTGLRELAFFAPIVIGLGLALGFLHPHGNTPRASMALVWIYIFIFIAVPEELFFRAWLQNLLEKRLGAWLSSRSQVSVPRIAQVSALAITSVLFGLSHFNKRSAHFNWRYVFLATIAGIFYGRAWRERRRVPASAITHACVDAIWTFWF